MDLRSDRVVVASSFAGDVTPPPEVVVGVEGVVPGVEGFTGVELCCGTVPGFDGLTTDGEVEGVGGGHRPARARL